MKIINLTSYTCADINNMAEKARDMVREGQRKVTDHMTRYQAMAGTWLKASAKQEKVNIATALKCLRYEQELASDLAVIASVWNTTRFTVVEYSVVDNECGDIYDYVAYFHGEGERAKFERENASVGNRLTVLTTYECGIDQLPDDEREDVIRDLFSEWV